jgi:hypothetical protein
MLTHFQPHTKEVTQMVRLNKSITQKGPVNRGRKQSFRRAIKIGPSTPYGYTDEHLTPFGGLLALEKLLDGLQFKELFFHQGLADPFVYWIPPSLSFCVC